MAVDNYTTAEQLRDGIGQLFAQYLDESVTPKVFRPMPKMATEETNLLVLTALGNILTKLSADPATQTTLAAILEKIITAPSTEAKQDALNGLIGEVQASPTENTLLARLKSLEDKIDAIITGTTPATVELLGSIKAEDPATGDAVNVTAMQDDGGDWVLRVVDAAPFVVEISKFDTPTHTAKDVTTASTQLLAANLNRKYVLIINNSDSEIWVSLGIAAVANMGILLMSRGSCYEMSSMAGNLYTGAINAIHVSTGNKQVLITEGV